MSTAEFTKYMIAQGMKELLAEKDFEKISVGDLAGHCHISRNTFYYHFRDKYDVVSWLFYSEIMPLIGSSPFVGKWADVLLTLCRYLQENKAFYIKVLQVEGQNSFTECLMEFHARLVRDLLVNAKGDQILTPEQIRTISNFYAFGMTGAISSWAKNGMAGDPAPVIETLRDLMSGKIFKQLLELQSQAQGS